MYYFNKKAIKQETTSGRLTFAVKCVMSALGYISKSSTIMNGYQSWTSNVVKTAIISSNELVRFFTDVNFVCKSENTQTSLLVMVPPPYCNEWHQKYKTERLLKVEKEQKLVMPLAGTKVYTYSGLLNITIL